MPDKDEFCDDDNFLTMKKIMRIEEGEYDDLQ
jgi:hypothetical protein